MIIHDVMPLTSKGIITPAIPHKRKRKQKPFIRKLLRKIKKNMVEIIICLVLYTVLLAGLHKDATYVLTGKVCDIDNKTNEVSVVDETGNMYSYFDSEDAKVFEVGDYVAIKFDHMGTESNRKDDAVLSVRPRSRKRNK